MLLAVCFLILSENTVFANSVFTVRNCREDLDLSTRAFKKSHGHEFKSLAAPHIPSMIQTAVVSAIAHVASLAHVSTVLRDMTLASTMIKNMDVRPRGSVLTTVQGTHTLVVSWKSKPLYARS